MRTMYDSVTPSAIPTGAAVVAGYVDGPYAWSKGDWERFPRAVKVRIATRATTNDGHVLDVEPGDATVAQAIRWVVMRRKAGVDPSIYCNQSTWPGVRSAFAAAKVAAPHYWIAHYDGNRTIPAGAVAKQYADPPNTGGHYDLSAVADHWPGVDQGEPDMQLSDKLNPNPPAGTVNEALNAVLFGITGMRSAGPLALAVYNIQRTVTAQSAAITALSHVIAAQQTNLSAEDIQNAVATEMARVAPANGFQVAPPEQTSGPTFDPTFAPPPSAPMSEQPSAPASAAPDSAPSEQASASASTSTPTSTSAPS